MEEELHVDRILVEDLVRHTAEAGGAGGVRAGWTDHDWSHDVENRLLAIVSDGHV